MCTKYATQQTKVNRLSEKYITKVPLRTLAEKRVSISTKKRLINQQGGLLVPLLSAILRYINSLIFPSRGT